MSRTLYSLLAALFALLISAASASACSCRSGGPPCESYGNTAAVFIGTPISVTITTTPLGSQKSVREYPQRLFTFQVDEGFRGVKAPQVQVITGMGGGDCGYSFQIGVRYLVYAGEDPETHTYGTSICTRTRPVSEAGEDLDYIRSFSTREPGAILSGEIRRYRTTLEFNSRQEFGPLSEIEILIESANNSYHARTDKEGKYRLTGLVPGKYKVKPLLPEQFSNSTTERETILNDRGCSIVSFLVTDNGRINGRVIDAAGEAVPKILLQLISATQADAERPNLMYAETDSDGRYRFKFVPPGTYLIGIRLYDLSGPDDAVAHYPRTFFPGVARVSEAGTITIGAGELVEGKDLTLLPRLAERTISGKVLLRDGSPAAGASVALYNAAYNTRPLGHAVRADDQGRFSFTGYEGVPYYVSAVINGPGGSQSHAEPVDVPLNGAMNDMTLVVTEANGTCRRCLNYRYGQNPTKQP